MSWYFAWQRDDPHSNDWEPPPQSRKRKKKEKDIKMKTIKLTPISALRDGGSTTYQGGNGNIYWRDFSITSAREDQKRKKGKRYGKLYMGMATENGRILAKGNFLVVPDDKFRLNGEIITQ